MAKSATKTQLTASRRQEEVFTAYWQHDLAFSEWLLDHVHMAEDSLMEIWEKFKQDWEGFPGSEYPSNTHRTDVMTSQVKAIKTKGKARHKMKVDVKEGRSRLGAALGLKPNAKVIDFLRARRHLAPRKAWGKAEQTTKAARAMNREDRNAHEEDEEVENDDDDKDMDDEEDEGEGEEEEEMEETKKKKKKKKPKKKKSQIPGPTKKSKKAIKRKRSQEDEDDEEERLPLHRADVEAVSEANPWALLDDPDLPLPSMPKRRRARHGGY